MDQQIRARYHNAILLEAIHRYGIQDDQIRPVDAFENFIYEFKRNDQAYILRISHSLHRNQALVQGELDWINYLAERGVSVARAVCSTSGQLVESIDDGLGGLFLVTAFVKSQGRPPWELWTPSLYETYGQMLGRMHALAKFYQPANLAWKRPNWDDDLFEFVQRYLPASEDVAKAKYQALCDHLSTLPKGDTSYGLIHQDAHGSNLLVDDTGAITLFDFDECAYSWFINDIAIALFYIVMGVTDAHAFTHEFLTHFFSGYRQKHRLDPHWLVEMPAFLKLREIEMYAVIHRDFDVSNINDRWCEKFMQDRKYKIEHDLPYIDFDFETFAPYL